MDYFDIHTHHKPLQGVAIQNGYPEDFTAEKGGFYSVGIHPWNAHLASEATLQMLAVCAAHKQVVAIGEVGIDKHSQASLPVQIELFKQQIALSESLHKPLVIHAVKAMDELLAVKRLLKPTQPWIIHGFRGNATVAKSYVDHGFYLSIGEKFQAESLLAIPNNRLFLETDESLLPIADIYNKVAKEKKVPMEQFLLTIGTTVSKVFPPLI